MSQVRTAATYVQKGGVAKTTSTGHMGVSAAQDHGLDVCLMDLAGSQNDLAQQFGLQDVLEDGVDAPVSAIFGEQWDYFRNEIEDIVDRMTYDTGEGPDLIPADDGLEAADNDLANVPREDRYTRLHTFIEQDLAPRYDLVLIDLPGAESNIALSGIYAAEDIVATARPGAFESQGLEKLEVALETFRESSAMVGRDPELVLLIPTMIDNREIQHKTFAERLREEYDVCSTPVRKSANVGSYQAEGRTLFDVEPGELYDSGRSVVRAYRDATEDLLNRVSEA